jgi:transposase
VERVVRVPTVEQEDNRQLHRELRALRVDRTRHINRIKGLLASYGIAMVIGRNFLDPLDTERLWDGRPLPSGLKRRLRREYERLHVVNGQIEPTPFQSGEGAWERGISKAGNRYIRSIAIEIAWDWLRYQPHSKLSLWYQERFGHGSPRLRRIGIVALARKLLIELWRYLETGVIPEGALLKA